jgi:hypothetical protein
MSESPEERPSQPPHQTGEPKPNLVVGPNRGKLYFCLGLLLGAAGLGAVVLLPQILNRRKQTVPTVSALLHVAEQPPSILHHPQSGPSSHQDFENYKRDQIALIKSRAVLHGALEEPKVRGLTVVSQQGDPITWLKRNLQVEFVGDEILRIGLSGARPEELVILVNAVVHTYLKELVNKEGLRRNARYGALKSLLATYDDKTRTKKQTLREITEALGSKDEQRLTAKAQLAKDLLLDYARELRRVHLALIDNQAKMNCQRTRNARRAMSTLRIARVEIAASQIAILAAFNPLGWYSQALSLPEIYPAGKEAQAAVRKLEEERAFLSSKEKLLSQQVQRLDMNSRRQNKQALDLTGIGEEIAADEKVLRKIKSEMEDLEIERLAPPRVSLLEDATVSQPD